ncbi:hypothetical protein [Streptomyces sp. NBC_01221]|uniref:hypothetical protein n=1 Tax=Streptomyces sp. NBC_01221 TaxID=2903782 RepID=UPI00338E3570
MKLVVRVKLLPTPVQASVLEATLSACNEAATWAAQVAFDERVRKNLPLRKLTYREIKSRWGLGAQAAQHAIKKTCDAYTTLAANCAPPSGSVASTPGSCSRSNRTRPTLACRAACSNVLRTPTSSVSDPPVIRT